MARDECRRAGEWERLTESVCAIFTGIQLHGEGFSGEITFGLNSEYSEQASYGKLQEEWVESVV